MINESHHKQQLFGTITSHHWRDVNHSLQTGRISVRPTHVAKDVAGPLMDHCRCKSFGQRPIADAQADTKRQDAMINGQLNALVKPILCVERRAEMMNDVLGG